ncbi:DEAD/DEAH box helicase family protein [Bacillus altitudinis]|uniref:DEAD/DEAH box helicase family protein n=1 Tax=Bacillus altitudinis TaxID=293387 RepID=UPI0024A973A6|nr:DEAD/DEAH box helicase family protein [Bacillus altitudinis]WHF27680.1 DEAD/DEAH box helicase family protein [Bacillus altitudinis]
MNEFDSFINFDQLVDDVLTGEPDDPRDIFDIIPNKNSKYEETLRPGQEVVLKKWYADHKDKHNTILKMNTGNGKTVVGLLILKSYLNRKMGPAVYVVPDNFLLEQVCKEAEDLNVLITKDVDDSSFINGDAILVVNMHKIFNGRSVFGVNNKKIDVGCIVIDDAHACMNIAKNQFSIKIPRTNSLYNFFLNTFESSIKQQNEIRFEELAQNEIGAQQLIPFWDWQSNLQNVRNKLMENKDDKEENNASLFFNWELLKDNLDLADCIISSNEITISVEYLPIESIPSFSECKHKIFMSATIEDDSILATHFNIDVSEIGKIVTPVKANDIGERMILIPQSFDSKISDDDLKRLYVELAKKNNIVILVPSDVRAQYWKDVAYQIIDNQKNLTDTIEEMKNRVVGIVVIKNRYDGIDLPKSACTVLVLDGIPDIRSGYDKYEEIILMDSSTINKEKVQRIEQGMGRATRSREDYSVVFLMGRNLVSTLYGKNEDYFTSATRKQLNISRGISRQIKNNPANKDIHPLYLMYKTSSYCLDRIPNWIQAHRKALLSETYEDSVSFDENILKLRKAFNLYKDRRYSECQTLIQEVISAENDNTLKGYLKFKLAKYQNKTDQTSAQEILSSARKLNNRLLFPINGIQYKKSLIPNTSQSTRISQFNSSFFGDANEYILHVQSIVDNLQFQDTSSTLFEENLKKLGVILGFISKRPENEVGKGPDNLWLDSEGPSFVIECKNEAYAETINKQYCNQLNGSINWFERQYDGLLNFVPIMIHPSTKFEYAASPHSKIRIIDKNKLELLKKATLEFSVEISANFTNESIIFKSLKSNNLLANLIENNYTMKFNYI